MALTLNGTFLQNLPLTEGESQRGQWVRGGFVIEFGDEYMRKAAFSTYGNDRIAQHASLLPGTPVMVSFMPQSREYNGRWYTELRCINIAPLAQVPNASPAAPAPRTAAAQQPSPAAPAQPLQTVLMPAADYDNDLPF